MLLNARQNSFIILFPDDFFAEEVNEKYKKYYQSLIVPYDTINEFMSATIQSINFPGWSMNVAQQSRLLGKKQEYKNSIQPIDLHEREITLTFKLTDAYMNYFIFKDNADNYLDFKSKKPTFQPLRLMLLDNQGYLVSSILFKRPVLVHQDGFKLSYSSVTPEFKTFDVKFKYFDFDLSLDFD